MYIKSENAYKTGIYSIAHNATFLITSKFIEKGLRFFYLIFLARFLGPKDLGLYNFGISSYLLFMPLALWGMNFYLSVELGRKIRNQSEIISTSLLIRLITSVISMTGCILIGWITSDNFQILIIVLLFSSAIFGRSFAVYGRDLFIAEEKSFYSSLSEIIFRILEITAGILLLLLGGGLLGVCSIHAGVWLFEGVAILIYARRKIDFSIYLPSFTVVKKLAFECFPYALYIIFWVGFQQIGIILIKNLDQNLNHLGYYAVGFQLIFNLILLPQVFSQAALPVLSRIHARGSGENVIFLETLIKLSCIISTSIIIFMLFFRESLVQIIFGVDFLQAANTLLIFCFCLLFLFVVPSLDKIVLSSNNKYKAVGINFMGFVLNVGLTFILYSKFTYLSPALAMTVSSSIILFMHLLLIHFFIFNIRWLSMVFRPYSYALTGIAISLCFLDYNWIGFLAGWTSMTLLFIFGRVFSKAEIEYFRKLLPNFSNQTASM